MLCVVLLSSRPKLIFYELLRQHKKAERKQILKSFWTASLITQTKRKLSMLRALVEQSIKILDYLYLLLQVMTEDISGRMGTRVGFTAQGILNIVGRLWERNKKFKLGKTENKHYGEALLEMGSNKTNPSSLKTG